MKLEMFPRLEEVICVADHDFELDCDPCLTRKEFREVFRSDSGLAKHMVDLVMVFMRIKEYEPDWKMSFIKKGRFHREKEDM